MQVSTVHLVMIVGCMHDYVWAPFSDGENHKEAAGVLIVVLDILCIIIMSYMVNKLSALNSEYLEIMDNNVILMSKFTVQINNI
jgi:hypothetical protein